MKFQYYPGCSAKGNAKAYEESFLSVFKALDCEIEELENWNCCGATAYMNVDEGDAFLLAGRNLAIAEKKKEDLIVPCSGCNLVLNKAQDYMKKYPEIGDDITDTLNQVGLEYDGTVKARHPLDALVNDIGLDTLKEKVSNPLEGLKVAPYYGCQIVRPYANFDDPYNPTAMDDVLKTIGCEVTPFSLKTKCCGGSLTGTISEVGLRLVYLILREAKRRGADCIATVCPLCQFNLEAYQDKIAEKYEDVTIPVVYFTQLAGLSMGLSQKELGLNRQFVPLKTPSTTAA